MITKAQGRVLAGEAVQQDQARLSALEKAMLRWVVVDPEDKLLDANVETGMMAEYLRRNMQCEVCGVSENMECVRQARSRLQSCDIVYAAAGDIPWHADQFDTVLYKLRSPEEDALKKNFEEVCRVLKPGGQLIIGLHSLPAVLSMVIGLFSDEGEKRGYTHQELENMLADTAFENISWQRTGINTGVLTAWKHKEGQDIPWKN